MTSESAAGVTGAGNGPAPVAGLAAFARRVRRGGPGLTEADERLLRDAVDALLVVARRHPGADLVVSLGPDGAAARLQYTNDGLVVRRATGRRTGPELTTAGLDETAVVTELASLLRAGEVET